MKLIFMNDQSFSFELLRNVGYAVYKGSDIGECLSTAYRIKEGDDESWYTEWNKTADRIKEIADGCLKARNMVSAREAYLRTSTYYRMAEFYLHGNPSDPRILDTWRKSEDAFAEAAKLFSPAIERVEIPYEGTTMPGYFAKVDDSNQKRPLLIMNQGFDSILTEMYFLVGAAALERGYNYLTFDGPGQGAMIREKKQPFRPDWEKVITPVVDYALSRPEVDPAKIALLGFSQGGILVPHALSTEHRVNAGILFDGLFDWNVMAQLPKQAQTLIQNGKRESADAALRESMQTDTNLRWLINHGMFVFNTDKPTAFVEAVTPFTMQGIADKIRCPMLILEGASDHFFSVSNQPQRIYDALTCPKKIVIFTAEEGAEEHCQVGANLLVNQRIFDWLNETLLAEA